MVEKLIKKMPILLGLGIGILLGMFFLYQKKKLSEVYFMLILLPTIGYGIGRNLQGSVQGIYNEYLIKKNSKTIPRNKEGNDQNIANNLEGSNEGESQLDLRVESSPDEFEELSSHIYRQ